MMAVTPAMLKANRQRRFRKQRGHVVQRADGYWLRYYTDDADGNRRKVTERLCDLDVKDVKNRCRKRMKEINEQEIHQQRKTPLAEITVGQFWPRYLAHAKEELRSSTVNGYEGLWETYLRRELEAQPLATYRTADGFNFLRSLKTKLNRNSIAHVRSLASGIFSYAVNLGKIDRNPWHDVKSPKTRAPRRKIAYTVAETKAIIEAVPRPDAKLFFAFCAVLGMRPSEAAGVRWENVVGAEIQVRQSVVKGKPEKLKTDDSERNLPLIEPVKSLLEAWRKECGGVKTGWLFTRPNTEPIEHSNYVGCYIHDFAKKVCSRWCGCYSGRHGAATVLFQLTGDARAANQVLGNSLAVVMENYIEPSTEAGAAGMKRLEQEHAK